jgi:hypothetical protein
VPVYTKRVPVDPPVAGWPVVAQVGSFAFDAGAHGKNRSKTSTLRAVDVVATDRENGRPRIRSIARTATFLPTVYERLSVAPRIDDASNGKIPTVTIAKTVKEARTSTRVNPLSFDVRLTNDRPSP